MNRQTLQELLIHMHVARFDAGGWWRYDDSQVNQTRWPRSRWEILFELFIDSEERVLGGNGRREGYIFTYVNQPQWDLWTAGMVDSWVWQSFLFDVNFPWFEPYSVILQELCEHVKMFEHIQVYNIWEIYCLCCSPAQCWSKWSNMCFSRLCAFVEIIAVKMEM